MSAVRRTDRRAARAAISSPYARNSSAPKKSGWSLSGLLGFLNPLRSNEPSDEEEDMEEAPQEPERTVARESRNEPPPPPPPPATAADTLSRRGHQLANQLPPPPPPPKIPSSMSSSNIPDRDPFASLNIPNSVSSPANNVKAIKDFLAAKGDTPLNDVEVRGLMSLLEQSVETKRQPFRFSNSPSRSNMFEVPPTTQSLPSIPSASNMPRSKLSKNPNGVYRWQGGGSSRPRNRHQSPAFGPSRPATSRLTLPPPAPTLRSDTKRRRVEEQTTVEPPAPKHQPPATPNVKRAGAPPPSPSISINGIGVPSPSVTNQNGALNPQTPPRLRPPQKPSAPAVPSPLRQTWSQVDSPPSVGKEPTQAASFMAELIKDATPTKKPDLSNPYQTASPVKHQPRKPSVGRKTRSATREAEKEKVAQPEKEAKGEDALTGETTKRSRAGSDVGKGYPSTVSASLPVNGHASLPPPKIVVEVIDDDDEIEELPMPKRRKGPTVNGTNHKSPFAPQQPTIEEIPDEASVSSKDVTLPAEVVEPVELSKMAAPAREISPPKAPSSPGRSFVPLKSSAPKEPSKLRFSTVAEKPESPPEIVTLKKSHFDAKSFDSDDSNPFLVKSQSATLPVFPPAPPIQKPSAATVPAPPASTTESTVPALAPSSSSFSISTVKPSAATTAPTVPAFASASEPSAISKPSSNDPKVLAIAASPDSLPKFEFKPPPTSDTLGSRFADARQESKIASTSTLPTYSFNFTASAAKTKPNGVNVTNPAPAFASTTTPSFAPASSTSSSSSFNWAAAGLKAPTVAEGSWTCDVCMVSNKPDAKDKCAACESPRPGGSKNSSSTADTSTSSSTPAVSSSGGFNWAAAGMKLPTAAPGSWSCDVCMISNKGEAVKCAACDSPKPGDAAAAPASASAPAVSPAPPSGGFNWAAAGMKVPTSAPGSWTCDVCMVSNKPEATEKCAACESPRPGAAAKKAETPSSGGFDWAAVGMKPPTSAPGSWACSVCMVDNKAEAKKCAACETPKS